MSVENINADLAAIKELAKHDLDFFAGLVLGEDYKYDFPEIHRSIWKICTEKSMAYRDFAKLAIGLPRGHAKSTLIKLFCVWLVLFSTKRFILIICASLGLAINMQADIADFLDSPNIIEVFGDWRSNLSKDTQEIKIFSFMGRNVILRAIGTGTATRGINMKNSRPDVMVMDDAQDKEESRNPELASKFKEWLYGTLFKCKSPEGCLYVYIGNMYQAPKDTKGRWACALRFFKESKDWISIITGAILSDGSALWEELHPVEVLLEEFRTDCNAGQAETFFAEVQNDPDFNANLGFNFDQIKVFREEDHIGAICEGRFTIIDPATDKPNADNTAKTDFEVWVGYPVVKRIMTDRWSPSALIEESVNAAVLEDIPLICAEGVAYQYSLLHFFQQYCNQHNVTGIEFQPVMPKGVAKNKRISEMMQLVARGDIWFTEQTKGQFIYYATNFNPLKTTNEDDVLDTIAYAPQVMQEYPEAYQPRERQYLNDRDNETSPENYLGWEYSSFGGYH